MELRSLWENIFRRAAEENDLAALLGRVPIFEGLSRRDLQVIERVSHPRIYSEGEAVFREGQPGVGMFVIQKGSVRIVKDKGGGSELELAVLSDGDFFGEVALLLDAPRSASAIAAGRTELVGISRTDLIAVMDSKPSLGFRIASALARTLAARLQSANREFIELQEKTVQ